MSAYGWNEVKDMVARWLREQADKPRFTLTRTQLESLIQEDGDVAELQALLREHRAQLDWWRGRYQRLEATLACTTEALRTLYKHRNGKSANLDLWIAACKQAIHVLNESSKSEVPPC